MFKQIAVWSPAILLALLVVVGLVTGTGVTPLAVVGLLGIQALVVGAPRAAHKLGHAYGERSK